MTLREFNDKISYYHREYDYYVWVCVRPHSDEDLNKRNEYYEKWQKMVKLQNKILENGLKSIDKDNY